MSNLSRRDRGILAGVGVAALYALAAAIWIFGQGQNWQKARKGFEKVRNQRIAEDRKIANRNAVQKQYREECRKMPSFEREKSVDAYWQRRVGNVAAEKHVTIAEAQAGDERKRDVGEVREIQIDVRNWQCSLESFVCFVSALEEAPDAMMEVRSVTMRPERARGKDGFSGFLKGQLTLACAFMRTDEAAAPPAKRPAKTVKTEKGE